MSRKRDQNPLMGRESSGPNWSRICAITLCIVLAIVGVGSAAIYYLGHNLISKTNYLADEDVRQVDTIPVEGMSEAEDADALKGIVLNQSEMESLHQQMNQVESIDTIMNEDVYNVILAGVDRRDKSWNGNSDSMMLVSINNEKNRVVVVSLMRDTYVEIPGRDYNKLNAAYAYGGGPLLAETIRENFRLDIDRYAAVDFQDMVEIIDAMGGVELTLTDAEVEVANGYMVDMCSNVLKIPYEEHLLPGGGTYNCDGVQAVTYARNRFVGNSDYARTQRQRYVISQMVEKIRHMGFTELAAFVTRVLPLITHNIPEDEIWDLVEDAPKLLQYSFVQDRVPYDNMYEVIDVKGQGMLVPNWDATITQMMETIYGDGSVSENGDNSMTTQQADTEFTDEYMKLTGGTGTLFPNGYGAAMSGQQAE